MSDREGAALADGAADDAGDDALAALRTAVEAADWPAVTNAVRRGWFTLVTDEHSETTRALLERVPASVLRAEPLIATELGIVLNKLRFHRLRAVRYFVMAVRAARSTQNSDLLPVDRVLIRTAESGALRLLGRTGASVAAARAAREQLDRLGDDDRELIADLPRIYAVIGVSLYYGGLPEEALDAAAHGLAEAPTTPPSTGMGALALLAGVHALRGDIPYAMEHIHYARTGPWTDRQRSMYSGVFYRIAEAVVALERFDADRARAELDSLIHGRHGTEHWVTVAQMRALTELVAGNPGTGLADLDASVAEHGAGGRSPRVHAILAPIRAQLQLALGNPDAAAAIVKRELSAGAAGHLERARVALALGQSGSALSELRSIGAERLSSRQAADAAALEAAVLLRISPTPRRDGVIERLGTLLQRTGQRLALALLPPQDRQRVTEAMEAAGYGAVTAELPERPLLPDVEPRLLLTRRERAVLEQLMLNRTTPEIAAALVVSANTVKTQLRSIYRKLGVSDREDAVAVALERHLLADED
ncbi:LuxR C-terminal-related transcriptional regulator [Leifsonia sp. C5G2]|uniref:helix-turn-helix transcriptional regulator n=1 Tax=Leifsonia sp. C5G2 TaxID=2735269 RepID=UPI0032DFB076